MDDDMDNDMDDMENSSDSPYVWITAFGSFIVF